MHDVPQNYWDRYRFLNADTQIDPTRRATSKPLDFSDLIAGEIEHSTAPAKRKRLYVVDGRGYPALSATSIIL